MNPEQFIREQIKKILMEQTDTGDTPRTTGVRGGVKRELRQLKALANDNPAELMNRLNVTNISGESSIDQLGSLLGQAISNTDEMADAYDKPQGINDTYNRSGLLISLTPAAEEEMTVRDATIFIRHTVSGAKNAGILRFDGPTQIEILNNDILVYPSKGKFTWNVPPRSKKPDKKK